MGDRRRRGPWMILLALLLALVPAGLVGQETPELERVPMEDQEFLLKQPALIGVASVTDCALPLQEDVYRSGSIEWNTPGRWETVERETVEYLPGGGIRFFSLAANAWVSYTGGQRITVVYGADKCKDAMEQFIDKNAERFVPGPPDTERDNE